jgi:hypothetical protein
VASVFADAGWVVPGMVAAMRDANGLFFDVVGQIRTTRWSSGRVVLVGDAAYEQRTRGFVTLNQEQVGEGDATRLPATGRALERRNDMLRGLSAMPAGRGIRFTRRLPCWRTVPEWRRQALSQALSQAEARCSPRGSRNRPV